MRRLPTFRALCPKQWLLASLLAMGLILAIYPVRTYLRMQSAVDYLKAAGARISVGSTGPKWLCRYVGESLFERILEVHLDRAEIDDELLRHFSVVAKPKSLDLSFRQSVSDAGLEHLQKLRTLRFLNVSGTRVTSAGIRKFVQSRPNCEVWNGSIANGGLVVDSGAFDFGTVSQTKHFRWSVTLRNPTSQDVVIEKFHAL